MSDDGRDEGGREPDATRPGRGPVLPRHGEFARAAAITRESRFETLGRLGSGGMGVVDEVHDRLLDRLVARKRLHPGLQERDEALERFVREVRVTARLQHPGIVAVHDARLDDGEGPSLFMPRLDGRALTELIDRAHAQEPEALGAEALADLVEIVVRASEAVSYAHDEGVLHRDLKPSNIMVGHYGEVFVLDWGIALERRPGDEPPAFADRPGSGLVGTPAYMAPETLDGRDDLLDARTDVYALGAVLAEILLGRPPRDDHPDRDVEELVREVAEGRSAAREIQPGPGRPPQLVDIVKKATAPRREDRHPGVNELRAELRRFLRGGGALPRVWVAEGEAVVREGEAGDCAYIVVEGRCRVLRERGGEATVRRELGPGDVFGETALLAPGPRTATVVAATDTVLLRVTEAVLLREVSALKPWLATLVRSLATRARELEDER